MDDERTTTPLRLLAAGLALLWGTLGMGWYLEGRWAVALWPWPEVAMSHLLLASMAVFIAAVWAAVAVSGEFAALAGAGLNIAVAGAVGAAQAGLAGQPGPAVAGGIITAVGTLLFRWARRRPVHDGRATPPAVRAGFVVFTLALGLAGAALALGRQVFPWPLHPGSLVPVGALFLGAAAYFAYAAAQPRWVHAAPPLWAFAAYDAVLCVPYLRLLDGGGTAVDDYYGGGGVDMTRLSVYLGIIVFSAALALYALLRHPTTRLWRRPAAPGARQ